MGINARSLNSLTPPDERDAIHKDLRTGHLHAGLLYVTPELCSQKWFREKLELVYKRRELARIAVDEAHCISEWGHDFRRDFKLLSVFREKFPDVPITCLTATANEQVRADVMSTLGLDKNPSKLKIFTTSAFRSNLHLEIRFTRDRDDSRLTDFVSWLHSVYNRRKTKPRMGELEAMGERFNNVPGIIYTISRDECESLASQLRHEGIGARHFHARLSKQEKEEILGKWVNNEPGYDIIVATTAFGMGIDKNNVRFVVHWRIPKSFEGYYQEAGRAGRDGNAAYCFLYYSREDMERTIQWVLKDNERGGSAKESSQKNAKARLKSIQELMRYCESTNMCRHAFITRYFGEKGEPSCDYACDYCKDRNDLKLRWRKGLASEQDMSTQHEMGFFTEGVPDYDEYAWDDYCSQTPYFGA